MQYHLERPTPALKEAHLAYLADWAATGEAIVPWASGLRGLEYEAWLQDLEDMRTNPPANRVPATLFAFLDESSALLGYLDLRHSLNEYLAVVGGHIGYALHPAKRQKGLAPKMLALGLREAKAIGLERVLLTCHKHNAASARTILHCDGVLENEVQDEKGALVQRYWIDLTNL